jgi:hypothetical protein
VCRATEASCRKERIVRPGPIPRAIDIRPKDDTRAGPDAGEHFPFNALASLQALVDAGSPGRAEEALIRIALKDLIAQLDPARFAQVHRSVVVNLWPSVTVSRSHLHLFRQM